MTNSSPLEAATVTYERLVTKLTKENLWLYILTELQIQPMYAYEIAKTLKNKHKIQIATVTAYVVLYKMRREGLVERRGPGRNPLSGRRYYGITELGRHTLQKGRDFLNDVLESIS